ncbi:MAG: helix-turn-helix transcriptional regulator [Burkholderiales bacterium]|nr:helix-turn-helix transcriptional regulator [Burkholderiales bacterium]
MDMIGRIRRLHSRRNKSEREISRMTMLSRNTVAKWLHGEVDGPPKYRRGDLLPDGHPNSPICGHLKFPHPGHGAMRR